MNIRQKVFLLTVGVNGFNLCRWGCRVYATGTIFPDFWSICGFLAGLILLEVYLLKPAAKHNTNSLFTQYTTQKLFYWMGTILQLRLRMLSFDVQSQQSRLLAKMLEQNRNTKCAEAFSIGNVSDVCDYLRKVPLTTYKDYELLANGIEEVGYTDVFFPGKVDYIALTSGTTSGKSKKIPKSLNIMRKRTGLWILIAQKCFMQIPMNNLLRKWLAVRIQPACWFSKSGIKCGPISGLAGSLSLNYYVAPKDVQSVPIYTDVIYLNIVFGLLDEEICNLFFSTSVMALLFFTILDRKWCEICDIIERGYLKSETQISDDLRTLLNTHLEGGNPARAAFLRAEFAKGLKNIVSRIWPKCPGVFCLATGAFTFQADILKDSYLGDVPIYSPFHAGTETMYGINLHLREPDVTYVAMTPINFFEFIPVDDLKKQCPVPVLAHEVKVGYQYEIVITTWEGLYRYRTEDIVQITGFYGTIPRYKFVRRSGDILSVCTEHVPEIFLSAAVKQAAAQWNRRLVDFTSTESIHVEKLFCNSNGVNISEQPSYVVFIEFQEWDGILTNEEKNKIDDELMKRHEIYSSFRINGKLSPVEVIQMKPGSFERLQKLCMTMNQETTCMQYKLPRIIRRETLLKCLLENRRNMQMNKYEFIQHTVAKAKAYVRENDQFPS